MMIRTLLATLALALATPLAADNHDQPDPQILTTVDAFMAGLKAKNAEAMMAVAARSGMLALIEEREGADRVRYANMESVVAQIASIPGTIEEPIYDEIVMQEGPVAMVLAQFDFILNGERSHCGTNIFTLMRVDGEWKIASITYSHIEEGCLAAPEE